MMDKISQAQEILRAFELHEHSQKIAALTLLALCDIKPNDNWEDAVKHSVTLSKDIMEFAKIHYNETYKPNTRESFRKHALKPFVDNNIALLNPDEPDLSPTSSKTHYAISDIALKAIKQFSTKDWEDALKTFKKEQFPENKRSSLLVNSIYIKNFKSVVNEKVDLGRVNVFIGTNGSGKSNILESIAMAGASIENEANFEGLYNRGVRLARPDLIVSSFLNVAKQENIEIDIEFNNRQKQELYLRPENENDIYTKWARFESKTSEKVVGELDRLFNELLQKELEKFLGRSDLEIDIAEQKVIDNKEVIFNNIYEEYKSRSDKNEIQNSSEIETFLKEYAIFDLNTKSLRGITPTDSRKTPLGINGEGLDILISSFNSYEKEVMSNKTKTFFDWLETIQSEKEYRIKRPTLKLGRSNSTLYFTDKYMQKQNNTFSAENSNEGILHVMFYLALFTSTKTPDFFAIDNIETALNPYLCKILISELITLAKESGKQVLITTHNPAVLDGLNLTDDEQRLFVVYRNDDGYTKTRRIKFKAELYSESYKLSEMWTSGVLGAIPKNF